MPTEIKCSPALCKLIHGYGMIAGIPLVRIKYNKGTEEEKLNSAQGLARKAALSEKVTCDPWE